MREREKGARRGVKGERERSKEGGEGRERSKEGGEGRGKETGRREDVDTAL